MNLLEAKNSSKLCRRPNYFFDDGKTEIWIRDFIDEGSWTVGVIYYPPNYCREIEGEFWILRVEDIFSNDWIVKEELLPCPLCGCSVELGEEEPSHEEGGFPTPGKVWIKCSNSKCIIEIEELLKFTKKEEFIEKWNNRVGKVRND